MISWRIRNARRASSLTMRSAYRWRKRVSVSVRPCHLSGIGRTALDSSSQRCTFTLSSPLRVVMTVPCTPTQSPRSRPLNDSNGSSPTTALETNSCTSPSRSRMVAKTSLPPSRDSMMRPAMATSKSVSTPASSPPCSSRSSASVWVRSKRYGYGLPPAARTSSTFCSRLAFSATKPLPPTESSSSSSAGSTAGSPDVVGRVSSLLTIRER
ncbi:unannotated protein [freshwater metagenome]|uniref:Unannotated protein n=1 Tax=freshwater metagenome TaxID=449393 RepID=A0A6J7C5E1_9ZZZZ